MHNNASIAQRASEDKRQYIKWIIYLLLLINFALYIHDDWRIAAHEMRKGGSFLRWTGAFATTLDEFAWFVLLILLELETYVLSDEFLKGPASRAMHIIRILCYIFIAHTLLAFGTDVYQVYSVTPVPDITDLCQLAAADVSYTVNLEYTLVDPSNCSNLSISSQFFYVYNELIVIDEPGLAVERALVWIDFFEALTWLCILLTIELTIRLLDKNIATGNMMTSIIFSKMFLYLVLLASALFWIGKGHFYFAWDEFLWVAGFASIEMNILDWRKEIIGTDNPEKISTTEQINS